MGKSDGGLWDHLKRTSPFPGKWRRVDARGMTDCIVYYGRNFFVELKKLKGWDKNGLVHLQLRPAQVSFFCSWPGEKYILAMIANELLWFEGPTLKDQSCIVSKDRAIPGPFKRTLLGREVKLIYQD